MRRTLAVGLTLAFVAAAGGDELSPEAKVLDRWVGTWKTEVVNRPSEWAPEAATTAGSITCKWVLGGKFVEESGSSLAKGAEHRVLWGYDSQRKAYRNWFFSSGGDTVEGAGTWDARTSTLTTTSDAGSGRTGPATHHFLDADTCEWTYVVKDADGKVYLDVKGKHTQVK
jgi:uncharacterized protein DUF1579